ncbi:MAG: hypothetical protein AAGA65_14860, partial [Actinomycetota bacterium]
MRPTSRLVDQARPTSHEAPRLARLPRLAALLVTALLVATSCGSSPDEEEEVVLPSAVGQIVADVTATCGSLASQAEAINRDVQGGLVDTTPEWEKVDEARVAYEEAMV